MRVFEYDVDEELGMVSRIIDETENELVKCMYTSAAGFKDVRGNETPCTEWIGDEAKQVIEQFFREEHNYLGEFQFRRREGWILESPHVERLREIVEYNRKLREENLCTIKTERL